MKLSTVINVIRNSNQDVGGRVVEMAKTEFSVVGKGYLRGTRDIEQLVVKAQGGTPVLVRDVARVELGPAERRGLTELNGDGEVVAGIVMARYGENVLDVINNLKEKIKDVSLGLPAGVKIVPVYDRSELIYDAIHNLSRTLIEEFIIVAAVCVIFLLHARSALVAIIMLPVGVLIALIAMHLLGISSNIMSLGGIAIAVGAMVDAAIVMIENAHKHLERLPEGAAFADRSRAIVEAGKEVGPALFYTLLIITVSFLPVFTLEGQEGRLFSPLAYTKTYSMAGAALLSVTLVPVLMMLFIRGKIYSEADNPISRFMIRLYKPLIVWAMKWKKLSIVISLIAIVSAIFPMSRIGSEFMPTLNEGSIFYMPVTLPGLSITKAAQMLQVQDKIFKSFPEVESVFGKAGRADTATDPAPTEMFETVINLKPESEWPSGMTPDKLISKMDSALQIPGLANSWTMPIKARIDMLSTGIRTVVGVKVFGGDLAVMDKVSQQIEAIVKRIPGTSSAFAERGTGGYYLLIEPERAQLARYGLAIGDLQDVVSAALGGEVVTTTVEGRERYGVNVRYPRELRSDPEKIAREVLVPVGEATGADQQMIPLGELARIELIKSAPAIRTEDALLSTYVYIDVRGRDIGSYVAEAQRAVREQVKFPPGYYATWSGQYEYMQHAYSRLKIVIPVTLIIIFLLLYLNFRNVTETLLIMSLMPFAVVGGTWLMWLLGYNLSAPLRLALLPWPELRRRQGSSWCCFSTTRGSV